MNADLSVIKRINSKYSSCVSVRDNAYRGSEIGVSRGIRVGERKVSAYQNARDRGDAENVGKSRGGVNCGVASVSYYYTVLLFGKDGFFYAFYNFRQTLPVKRFAQYGAEMTVRKAYAFELF